MADLMRVLLQHQFGLLAVFIHKDASELQQRSKVSLHMFCYEAWVGDEAQRCEKPVHKVSRSAIFELRKQGVKKRLWSSDPVSRHPIA